MITITGFFQYTVPYLPQPDWSVPFMPWPASISIFLNIFLMTTLKVLSFQRFAIWSCLITIFYVLYGVHSTYQAEENEINVDEQGTNSLPSKVELQVL